MPIIDIWGWIILFCGSCPANCRMFSNIYPPGTRSTSLPQFWQPEPSSVTAGCPMVENHWFSGKILRSLFKWASLSQAETALWLWQLLRQAASGAVVARALVADRSSGGRVLPFFHLPGDLASLCQDGFSGGPVITNLGRKNLRTYSSPLTRSKPVT